MRHLSCKTVSPSRPEGWGRRAWGCDERCLASLSWSLHGAHYLWGRPRRGARYQSLWEVRESVLRTGGDRGRRSGSEKPREWARVGPGENTDRQKDRQSPWVCPGCDSVNATIHGTHSQ